MIVEACIVAFLLMAAKHGANVLIERKHSRRAHRALMLAPVRDERGLAVHLPSPSSTHQPRATRLLDAYQHELESNAAWAADPPATAPPWARPVPIPDCLQCGEARTSIVADVLAVGLIVHAGSLVESCQEHRSWRDKPLPTAMPGPLDRRRG